MSDLPMDDLLELRGPMDDLIGPALYHAYDTGSMTGVEMWVEKHHPEWPKAWCVPCEAETYTWPGSISKEGDVCAVCWTAR